jgi:hypothetical protein
VVVSSVAEYIERINTITTDHMKIAHEEYETAKQKTSPQKTPVDYDDAVAKQTEKKLKEVVEESTNIDASISKIIRYRFFYRGHYKRDYNLIPSVLRGNEIKKEDYYYHEILVRCPEHFQFLTHLDKLVMMQHYDCPTRLLDVTTNPLVALFFACKSFVSCKCKHKDGSDCDCNKSTGGKVIVFKKPEDEVSYADSDKALMLSCIPRFTYSEKEHLWKSSNDSLSIGKFTEIKGGSRYEDETVERLFHEIATENPAFKRKMKPIDLLQPLFIQPNKSNRRIMKQDGAFILSGFSENADDAESKIKKLLHDEIIIENQFGILKELEQLEIHEASLFPEVDKVANYLKER